MTNINTQETDYSVYSPPKPPSQPSVHEPSKRVFLTNKYLTHRSFDIKQESFVISLLLLIDDVKQRSN
jgi:hypothetical protein